MRAEEHNAETTTEIEALQAVYAYEELLYKKNAKRYRANRTWQMINRHGIIEAVERAVRRDTAPQGYKMLVEMGLQKHALEAVILRQSKVFSREAVDVSSQRLTEWSIDPTRNIGPAM